MKIVAVRNDHTGNLHAVLDGYTSNFPYRDYPAESIEYGECYPNNDDYFWIKILRNGYREDVSSEHYSVICVQTIKESRESHESKAT